jgi:outer membrane protein, heavy metal efflux system
VYQLIKSNSKYWLNSCLVLYVLTSSLVFAGQNESREKNAQWLDLIEQDPVEQLGQIDEFNDLVRVALRNSSQLKAQYAEWEMKREEAGTIIGLPDPSLSLGYFIEPVETAQGPQRTKVSLGQTIPWFSKTKAKKQAKWARAEQAYEALENTKLHLIRELSVLWAEALYLQTSRRITEQKLALATDLEAVLQTQYKSASTSHQKYANTQIQTLDLIEQLHGLQDKEYRVRIDLGAILEINTPVAIPRLQRLSVSMISGDSPTNPHPRLTELDHLLQEAQAQRAKTRADYIPDLRVGLDYILTDPRVVSGVEIADSGQDPLVFSVGLALPVWNWGAKRSAVEASKWQEKRVQALRTRETIILKQEYENANSLLTENLRQMTLYEDDLLPKAHEIVEVMEQSYISQSVNIETFTKARQNLLDLEMKLAKAKHSAAIQQSVLTYLRGE